MTSFTTKSSSFCPFAKSSCLDTLCVFFLKILALGIVSFNQTLSHINLSHSNSLSSPSILSCSVLTFSSFLCSQVLHSLDRVLLSEIYKIFFFCLSILIPPSFTCYCFRSRSYYPVTQSLIVLHLPSLQACS